MLSRRRHLAHFHSSQSPQRIPPTQLRLVAAHPDFISEILVIKGIKICSPLRYLSHPLLTLPCPQLTPGSHTQGLATSATVLWNSCSPQLTPRLTPGPSSPPLEQPSAASMQHLVQQAAHAETHVEAHAEALVEADPGAHAGAHAQAHVSSCAAPARSHTSQGSPCYLPPTLPGHKDISPAASSPLPLQRDLPTPSPPPAHQPQFPFSTHPLGASLGISASPGRLHFDFLVGTFPVSILFLCFYKP